MLNILKIKGTKTIPDFVQVRDEQMTLIAYFRLNQIEKGLTKNNLTTEIEGITKLLNKIPFGIIHIYSISNEQ
ncbi:MAG: fructose-6-phosphate aldolase [Flavobacteriales bacterium]|nr:fructose-6-phosphate aldolase [Flavobacteriales bacterium]